MTTRAQHFTLAQGRAAGMTEWQLQRSGLRRPTRGVRTHLPEQHPSDIVTRCAAVLPVLPRSAVFTHSTALDLYGIDRPRGLSRPDDLHVLVRRAQDRPQREGVVSHYGGMPWDRTVLIQRIPVLPVEQVWCRAAAGLSLLELIVLGDALIRRSRPWSSIDDLTSAVAAVSTGTRGVARLREALPMLRAGTDSCQETRLRWTLVSMGLPCPEVNRPIHGPDGRFVALPDLSYPRQRLVIEYDGDVHRTDQRVWRRDTARRRELEAMGWRMLTCTADDLRDPGRLIADVRRALRR